jgi:hypothetical protein
MTIDTSARKVIILRVDARSPYRSVEVIPNLHFTAQVSPMKADTRLYAP